MADDLCTVDFAAERLRLHPKTVLRYIREGRLKATRLGKAYRILRSDIETLAGAPPPAAAPADEARVTSIVDIPGVGEALAAKWARSVTSALNQRPPGPPLRADVIHEPERSHLKIVVVGSVRDTANLMSLIAIWMGQLVP